MLKTLITILAGLCIITIIGGYIFWGNAKEKIAKAEQDLRDYQSKYETIKKTSDSLDTIVNSLNEEGQKYQFRIDSLEIVIVDLEEERQEDVIKVAELFQPDELVEEMKLTFPNFRNTLMGVARVKHPRTGFTITTFQIPMQLVSSFIADRNDLNNYKKQMTVMGDINLTYKSFVALKDSIIILKEQKAEAYRQGMEYGMVRYDELVNDYIKTLKKPPKIGFPSAATILTTGALGVAAGVVIGKK